MYDSSGAGVPLRRFTGVSLAWWHNYKWCTKRLIVVFADDFIAPMYHFLYPTTSWNAKNLKHSAGTALLSYIRLAYPTFRAALRDALSRQTILPHQRQVLTNLLHLCEYFIPVVCFSIA
jgi:hypothetical protein